MSRPRPAAGGGRRLGVAPERLGADKSSSSGRATNRAWYFLAMAVLGAAAIIAFAVLPQQIAVVGPVLAIAAIAALDRVARRSTVTVFSGRPGWKAIVYLVVLAIVWIAALALAGTLARSGDSPGLPWILAAAVFVVTLVGAWIPNRNSAQEAASAS